MSEKYSQIMFGKEYEFGDFGERFKILADQKLENSAFYLLINLDLGPFPEITIFYKSIDQCNSIILVRLKALQFAVCFNRDDESKIIQIGKLKNLFVTQYFSNSLFHELRTQVR